MPNSMLKSGRWSNVNSDHPHVLKSGRWSNANSDHPHVLKSGRWNNANSDHPHMTLQMLSYQQATHSMRPKLAI